MMFLMEKWRVNKNLALSYGVDFNEVQKGIINNFFLNLFMQHIISKNLVE